MNTLHYGLTPKMKPISPHRSAVVAALDRLVALDRDKKLWSRDISMVDLRLADRVSVRLSDAAAQARDEALQANKKKKKGGDA